MNNTTRSPSSMSANIGNVILGVWVAISPFVLGFSELEAAMWNNVAVGIAVMVLAFSQRPGQRGASVVNMLLGGWLIASPFVLGFSAPVPFWNNIILGVVILVVAMMAGTVSEPSETTLPPPNP